MLLSQKTFFEHKGRFRHIAIRRERGCSFACRLARL